MSVHLLLLLCLMLSIHTNAETFTNNDCPTILYPEPYQTDVDINDNLVWESQPDENYYLSLGITLNGKEVIDSLYLGNTDFYFFEYLTHNTTYYARIQVVGDTLNECEPIIFTTGDVSIPDCTEILTPPDGLTDVMINTPLIWLDVDNILGYYVQVGTTPGGHDVVNTDVIENNLYLDELEYNTDYFVNITPYNEYAVAVGCPEQHFTTMPAIVPPPNPDFVITCPENIEVIESQGTGERAVSFDEPQVTHNCSENSSVSIQQIAGGLSGSSFAIGITTIMYEVRLDCIGTIYLDTCYFEINVEADSTNNPILLADCGSSQTFVIPESDESVAVTWQLPTASTTCSEEEISLQQIAGPPIGSDFTDGQSETITYTIRDNCGNSTTCSFEVTAQKTQGNCPTNIEDYIFLGEYNGHRYLQSEFQLSWQDASDAAVQLGGHLVSIDTEEENKFIVDKIDKILFIGLSDYQTEGTNTWDSGDPITYNNFIGNNNDADDYGTIHFWNGEWEFVNVLVDKEFIVELPCNNNNSSTIIASCGDAQTFVIPESDESVAVTWQLPTASTTCSEEEISLQQIAGPSIGSNFTDGQSETITYTIRDNCGNSTTCSFEVIAQKDQGNCSTTVDGYRFLGEYNGHRYLQSEFQLSWQDASDAAVQLGGHLVSIDTEEENKFIIDKIDKILFIGLSDYQIEGTNTWDSGDPITYDNFIGNNNDADDYGTIHFWNGEWEFVNVLVDKEFIVEMPCEASASQNSQDDNIIDPILRVNKIFPNPTSDIVHLQVKAKEYFVETIKLYNSQGQLKFEESVEISTGNNTINLNVKELPTGIYFISIPGAKEELSWHKLIKL